MLILIQVLDYRLKFNVVIPMKLGVNVFNFFNFLNFFSLIIKL